MPVGHRAILAVTALSLMLAMGMETLHHREPVRVLQLRSDEWECNESWRPNEPAISIADCISLRRVGR